MTPDTDGVGWTHRKPARWRPVVLGACFGVFVVFVVNLLYWGGTTVWLYLSGRADDVDAWYPTWASTFMFWLAESIIALLPAMAGGGLNALVLYQLSRRRSLSVGTGLLSGVLIVGFFLVPVFLWLAGIDSSRGWDSAQQRVAFALLAAGRGAICGAWHGWVMVRWLRKARQ